MQIVPRNSAPFKADARRSGSIQNQGRRLPGPRLGGRIDRPPGRLL